MPALEAALEPFAGILALGALVVAVLALLLGFLGRRRRRSAPPARSGATGTEGLEWALEQHREEIERLGRDYVMLDGALAQASSSIEELRREEHELGAGLEAIAGRTRELEIRGRKAVQRVGLVRFNPFEDTGSNQSFALALLDDDEDGIVLSSLHSRQSTRFYLKPIVAGRSDVSLSSEESEALGLASAHRVGAATGT